MQLAERYLKSIPDFGYNNARNMRGSVRRWARLGGPALISRLTTEHFDAFRAAAKADGLRPATIESTIANLRTLLRFAGPRGNDAPHGKGWLQEVPWTGRKLRLQPEPKTAVPLAALSAVYDVASLATYPRMGMPPGQLLRALLVSAYNTGLRLGDLLERVTWDAYDPAARTITLVASKTSKRQVLPVNDVLAAHLDTLPRRRKEIFGIPRKCDHYLRTHIYALCDAVRVERFAFHAIRRRAAVQYELVHAGAGSLILGHTLPGQSITWSHYIDPLAILRPASNKIEQPPAFVRGAEELVARRTS